MDGHQLRELRRQHGLTRADLAAKAQISTATIARLEQQTHPTCRTYTVLRLAEALGADEPPPSHPRSTTPPMPRTRELSAASEPCRNARAPSASAVLDRRPMP